MKSAAVFLLLLLCLSSAFSQGQIEHSVLQVEDARTGRTEVDVPLELPDLWDELRGLKQLVLSLKAEEVERRLALRSMESRLRDGEVEAEQQRRSLDRLEGRTEMDRKLVMELKDALRRKVEELQEQSAVRAAKLSADLLTLQSRLNNSESSAEDLKTKNAVLAARLCNTERLMEELRRQNSAYSASNRSSQSEASELESRLNVRLEELNTNTEVLQSRLNSLQEQLNTSADGELRVIQDEVSEVRHRLNSSQLHLDELTRLTADQTSGLWSVERHLDELKTENTAVSSSSTLEENLWAVKSRLQQLETNNTVLEAELSAVTLRQNVTEEQMVELKTQNTAAAAELTSVSVRLAAAERETKALQVRLRASEQTVSELRTENEEIFSRLETAESLNTGIQLRLTASDRLIQKLQNQSSDKLKVAFSASLTDSGSVGPFDDETTLIFSKTITNIGQAYNQTAGVFTAPLRGLYFFSFTAADYVKGYMGLYLYRNNQPIIFNLDLNDHGGYASTSNGVALQLEEGDLVRLSLPASYRLYDDSRNFSVFSGFLLFPL
ncbi:hypothetical protein PAMP_006300 [Pampus punctatissimus]